MTKRKVFTEKRKHKRFKVKRGAFAVSAPDYNKLGQITDISKDGLAFQYIENGQQTKGLVEVEIFSTVDDFYLKKLPIRTALDFEANKTVSLNSMPIRQLNIQFGKLNHNQKLLLDYFLQKYTHK